MQRKGTQLMSESQNRPFLNATSFESRQVGRMDQEQGWSSKEIQSQCSELDTARNIMDEEGFHIEQSPGRQGTSH